MDKISALNIEKGRVVERFGMMKSLITPKLSMLETHLTEMEKVEGSMSKAIPTELKETEIASYAMNGLIHVSELLIKSWVKEVMTLKDSFQDILRLVSKH